MLVRLKTFGETLGATLVSLLRLILFRPLPLKLPKCAKSSLLVLGNGPSLLESLNTVMDRPAFDVLACNWMIRTETFDLVKPEVYVLTAPEYFLKSASEKHLAMSFEFMDLIRSKVHWPMLLVLPREAKAYMKRHHIQLPSYVTLCYFNNIPLEGFAAFESWGYRYNLGVPRPHNVLIPALTLSINLGYQNIYLLGVENSMFKLLSVDENNVAYITDEHFYSGKEKVTRTMHNRGQGSRKLHEILEKFYLSFRGYFKIRGFADRQGVNIYNTTPESYIDAFERRKNIEP